MALIIRPNKCVTMGFHAVCSHLTSILTTISAVESTGFPFFIAGINRHFLRLSSNILLRRRFVVGFASSTFTLPSTAIRKRASAANLNTFTRSKKLGTYHISIDQFNFNFTAARVENKTQKISDFIRGSDYLPLLLF